MFLSPELEMKSPVTSVLEAFRQIRQLVGVLTLFGIIVMSDVMLLSDSLGDDYACCVWLRVVRLDFGSDWGK